MDSINLASEFNVNYNIREDGEIDIIIEKSSDEGKKILVNAHLDSRESIYVLKIILNAITSKLRE